MPKRPLPPRWDAEESQGEFLSICERVVVAPAAGSFSPRQLQPGDVVAEGEVLGCIRQQRGDVAVHAPFAGTFLSWLALDGGRVAGGQMLARILPSAI